MSREIALSLIQNERSRQVTEEGWSGTHDDQHSDGELLRVAVIYLHHGTDLAAPMDGNVPMSWPWDAQWWKPKTRIRNLERAGALALAEKQRLERAGKPSGHAQQKLDLIVDAIVQYLATTGAVIDSLKAAKGPSRDLDADIFIQVTPGVLEAGRIDRDGGVVGWWPKDTAYQSAREVPLYTSSLDAAVKLIPDGLFWLVGYGHNGPDEPLGGAGIIKPGAPDDWITAGEAATPALAMCIAALLLRHGESDGR